MTMPRLMVPVPEGWRVVTRATDAQVQYVNMWYVVRIVLNGTGGSTLFFADATSTEITEVPELLPPPAALGQPEPEIELGPGFEPDYEPESDIMAPP